MNVKSWIPLIAAVLLGLIALVVAKKAMNKAGNGPTAAVVGVAVASRELPPGRELGAEDLTVMQLPVEAVPVGSFRTVQELVGRTTLQPMVKGQTMIEATLAPTGTRGGLTSLIPEGYRAMTLEVNEFTGLAGMLQPGAHVDIIAMLREEKTSQSGARTILQNIEVRAVGRNYNPQPPVEGAPPAPPSNNVTLLVTPRQAQILQLATQNGRPWLVLRNGRDKIEGDSELVTLAELRNERPLPPMSETPAAVPAVNSNDPFGVMPTPPKAAARVVQIIRGGVESTVTIPPQSAPATPIMAPASTQPTLPTAPKQDRQMVTDIAGEQKPVQ